MAAPPATWARGWPRNDEPLAGARRGQLAARGRPPGVAGHAVSADVPDTTPASAVHRHAVRTAVRRVDRAPSLAPAAAGTLSPRPVARVLPPLVLVVTISAGRTGGTIQSVRVNDSADQHDRNRERERAGGWPGSGWARRKLLDDDQRCLRLDLLRVTRAALETEHGEVGARAGAWVQALDPAARAKDVLGSGEVPGVRRDASELQLDMVLQFLMDDVSDFLSTHFSSSGDASQIEEKGCASTLKAFIDYISLRETENVRSRKEENENSITLTTIHQSKGLEWDVVFIVQANDSEIPLLHEYNGTVKEAGSTLEEERRLFYVAMTRARKKLYILHVTVDSYRQLLPPSRFLREIPVHLLDMQGDGAATKNHEQTSRDISFDHAEGETSIQKPKPITEQNETSPYPELMQTCLANDFLKRFEIDDRAVVSHIFYQWAKKQAFQIPKRLLDKIKFVIDERLRGKGYKRKDVLCKLKSLLSEDEALGYAEYVIKWEQIPIDKRSHLMRERQEHFQKQRIENSMGSSEPTPKQVAYLRSLGCTITPTSRLHASNLIEKYKSL